MFYKLDSRKGNIVIILIGLISVMLIMVMIMSRRMTGHTQLLTLSDYTQVSRYFLESYMSDVMRTIRSQSFDSGSKFSEALTSTNPPEDITRTISYTPSPKLKALADELKIKFEDEESKPKISFFIKDYMEYIDGLNVGEANSEKEKEGLLQIVCGCNFQGRKYVLTVQYPVKVVFRLTPVLKNFMLFVENMADEQTEQEDNINILKIGDTDIADAQEQDLGQGAGSYKIKPFTLLQPLDGYYMENTEYTGRVYLGPSNEAVFFNLAGGKCSSDRSDDSKISVVDETSIVKKSDFSHEVDNDEELEITSIFEDENTHQTIQLPGFKEDLAHAQGVYLGVMGYSTYFSKVFSNTSCYKIDDFLSNGQNIAGSDVDVENTYWGKMTKKYPSIDEMGKAMSYASALRLYGLPLIDERRGRCIIPTRREVYGNIYGRFLVLSFWDAQSNDGGPLKYQPGRNLKDNPVTSDEYNGWGNGLVTRVFTPLNESLTYEYYQSRVMSGLNWTKDLIDKEARAAQQGQVKNFMPINYDYVDSCHKILSEGNYEPQDGIQVKSPLTFDKFGQEWLRVADLPSESANQILKTLEARICRTFANQEEFLEGVGYNNGKFNVGGVVYVNDSINLGDMNLSPDKCSGGIVIVNGNIELGNIYRGESFDTNSFDIGRTADSYYMKWSHNSNDEAIKQDKILTFICLNEGNSNKIILNGSAYLGVHLIAFNQINFKDQIEWKSNDRIVFYGAIACSQLNMKDMLKSFGNTRTDNNANFDGPYFMYPPCMGEKDISLSVQIMENMLEYELTSSFVGNQRND